MSEKQEIYIVYTENVFSLLELLFNAAKIFII